jgi:hypothetical protein
LTKNAGTLLLQHVAASTDPADMQIVSFHPGGILTEMAKAAGFVEEAFEWDDGRSLLGCSCLRIQSASTN